MSTRFWISKQEREPVPGVDMMRKRIAQLDLHSKITTKFLLPEQEMEVISHKPSSIIETCQRSTSWTRKI